jgi:uncharacterized protein (DUF1778 family)
MTMAPSDKSARVNLRISEDEEKMLNDLAEAHGINTSEAVRLMIRTTYKLTFPDRAQKYETAAERFERQIMSLATPPATTKTAKRTR